MASPIFNQPIKNPLDQFKSYGDLCDTASGPISFLSNVFQLIALIAGLWALTNLLLAGIQYIGAQGDPKQIEQAWAKITMSFIGLLIIIGAFTIAAIIGQLLFGDPKFIFTPQVYGPGSCS